APFLRLRARLAGKRKHGSTEHRTPDSKTDRSKRSTRRGVKTDGAATSDSRDHRVRRYRSTAARQGRLVGGKIRRLRAGAVPGAGRANSCDFRNRLKIDGPSVGFPWWPFDFGGVTGGRTGQRAGSCDTVGLRPLALFLPRGKDRPG